MPHRIKIFFSVSKNAWILTCLLQSKDAFLGIPFIGCNVFELFCMPLYEDYEIDLRKKFQVESMYDTNLDY